MLKTVGKTQLSCFSPPVMLATFIIEVALAMYVVWRYKLNRVSRIGASMLICLAVFQLAEYMVCGGLGVDSNTWARLGYASITALPALGVHLAYALAGVSNKLVVGGSYAVATGFIGYFLLATDVFTGSQCMGNYVIFQLGSVASQAYTLYYYGLLLLGIALCATLSRRAVSKRKHALLAFMAGYILFMVPTTVVNTIDPSTIAGIPSIMCGFAVVLALILAFWVMPFVAQPRAVVARRKLPIK